MELAGARNPLCNGGVDVAQPLIPAVASTIASALANCLGVVMTHSPCRVGLAFSARGNHPDGRHLLPLLLCTYRAKHGVTCGTTP